MNTRGYRQGEKWWKKQENRGGREGKEGWHEINIDFWAGTKS
jgi:hypothetical protein